MLRGWCCQGRLAVAVLLTLLTIGCGSSQPTDSPQDTAKETLARAISARPDQFASSAHYTATVRFGDAEPNSQWLLFGMSDGVAEFHRQLFRFHLDQQAALEEGLTRTNQS